MLRWLILILLLARPLHAEPVEVDLELVLAVDVSRSMTPLELEIQRRGYAEALTMAYQRYKGVQTRIVRIFNTFHDHDIKDGCLRSIANIGTDEACEFLLDVVRSNPATLGPTARGLLEKNAQERMLSALERNRRREPDPGLRLFIGRLVDQIRTRRGSMAY